MAHISKDRSISFSNRLGQVIPGIYHYSGNGNVEKSPRNAALLIHGLLSHKNNALFRALAASLPVDSFRIDIPYYEADNATFRYGSFEDDLLDIVESIQHIQNLIPCHIIGLIGHSRGANLIYAFSARKMMEQFHLQWVIPIAGRFLMFRGPLKYFGQEVIRDLETGKIPFFEWNVRVKNQNLKIKMTNSAIRAFINYRPLEDVKAYRDSSIPCLIIHGEEDDIIPVSDAKGFYTSLHCDKKNIKIVPGADHSFSSHTNELCSIINQWIHDIHEQI